MRPSFTLLQDVIHGVLSHTELEQGQKCTLSKTGGKDSFFCIYCKMSQKICEPALEEKNLIPKHRHSTNRKVGLAFFGDGWSFWFRDALSCNIKVYVAHFRSNHVLL